MEVEGWADEGPPLPVDMDALTQSIAQGIVNESIAKDIVQSIESTHSVDTAEPPAAEEQADAEDQGELGFGAWGLAVCVEAWLHTDGDRLAVQMASTQWGRRRLRHPANPKTSGETLAFCLPTALR